MALQYLISSGSITLVGGAIKTVIECPAASTVPFVVYAMEITCSLSSGSSLTMSWWSYTVAGTGGTTVTPLKWGVDQSVAAITGTIKVGDTGEPSGTLTQLSTLLIPLPGMYSIIYPFGRETYIPVSSLRCLRATGVVAMTIAVNLYIEQ